jgi:pyruvate-ferredoxin/flavodoxin oxidoreductase
MYKTRASSALRIHVSARAGRPHAQNIFGDHSDVNDCRQTGFAMQAESNVQDVIDLSAVAHLSSISGRVPLSTSRGFRTSQRSRRFRLDTRI